MITEYKLTEDRGLLFAFIGNKKALIDTGSPITLSEESFVFAGEEIIAKPNLNLFIFNIDVDAIKKSAGIEFDIFLGNDVLKRRNVALILSQNKFLVGDEIEFEGSKKRFEYSDLTGFTFDVKINNRKTKTIFDTGATISYISDEFTQNLESVSVKEDFHPLCGRFTTNIYNFIISIVEDKEIPFEFGNLPPLLDQIFRLGTGIGAIVGIEVLKHYDCFIDWKNSTITLKAY